MTLHIWHIWRVKYALSSKSNQEYISVCERKMVLCRTTDQFYPESQTIYCEDCRRACWVQVARTNHQYPGKFYCPKHYQRHVPIIKFTNQVSLELCQNVLPGETRPHRKFEIEPHYLEEGSMYEEIFCHFWRGPGQRKR